MMPSHREDFPLLRESKAIYIDSAATAQRPDCVIQAEADFYARHNANPLRGFYELGVDATQQLETARDSVRDFLHAADSAEIIFTRNTTESLNLVAYSYALTNLRPGDEVVVSIMEHHSNLLPWQMAAQHTGATLRFLECDPDGSLPVERIQSVITDKTRLVAVTHVSNVLGHETPVKAIAAAGKAGGWRIMEGKNCTEFGIGVSIAEVVRAVFHDEDRILPISVLLDGQYGQHDVYASVPARLNREGVADIIELNLTQEEQAEFAASCKTMDENYRLALTL